MHRKGTWSPGRSTHNQRVCKGREGGRVTCRQSANGEIKEDTPYIYIPWAENMQRNVCLRRGGSRGVKHFTAEEAETMQCNHKGQDTPSEFQWGGSGAKDTSGRSMHVKAAAPEAMLQLEAGCSVNVPVQKATEQQLMKRWISRWIVQQGPWVALNYGTSEAISSYDHYILRLKHPGMLGHWI